MTKTIERLKTVLTVKAHGFCSDFTKEFSESDLTRRIQEVALVDLPKTLYHNSKALQRELLTNVAFPGLLKKLQGSMESVPVERLNIATAYMRPTNTRLTDYPFEDVQDVLAETSLNEDAIALYITRIDSNRKNRTGFIDNLNAVCRYGDFFQLSPAAQALFGKSYLSGYIYASSKQAIQVCEMLASEPVLQEIAEFLFEHAEDFYFNIDELEKLKVNPQEALDGFKAIYKLLKDKETMGLFLEWWRYNCSFKELRALAKKLAPLSAKERENAMQSKSSYASLLYGKAISGIDLTDLSEQKEDIIIYALSAQRRGFIRLIEENTETFLSLPSDSLLLDKEFYTKYINLNVLNANNLKEFAHMVKTKINLERLADQEYTFEEIKTLCSAPRQYTRFYGALSIQKVDGRLLVLRQLLKKKLLAEIVDDTVLVELAAILSEKPLYTRIREEFSHIKDVKATDVIGLLLVYDKISRLVPQMKDRLDVSLVLRNTDDMQNFESLDEAKSQLENIDTAWIRLRTLMEFDDDFVKRNREQIIRFLIRDGAKTALTYYDNSRDHLTDSQRESFKMIVKAELMNKLSALKHYRDDLALEVDYPISKAQKLFWQENESVETQGISATENDDFYSTMLLGVQPQRTCLSYIDGQHRECLLSNFDTSKKILYAEVGGKIVGRALLRLTKGRFHDEESVKRTETLSFVDVENLPGDRKAKEERDAERLVLFLERPYIAGIPRDEEKLIDGVFIKLAESKADKLGAMLVLNKSYMLDSETDYAKTHINLFISRSKAGKQYIDSLNGSAEITDEGSYRSNTFLIRQKDI